MARAIAELRHEVGEPAGSWDMLLGSALVVVASAALAVILFLQSPYLGVGSLVCLAWALLYARSIGSA
jgi:hypothetical protein